MRVFWLGIIAVLIGCDGGAPVTGVEGNLSAQRVAWEASGLDDYDFDLYYANMWIPPIRLRIQVRNGVATKAHDLATGNEVAPSGEFASLTIDSLFAIAEEWRETSPASVALLFHPVHSYPMSLSWDVAGWIDEEQTYAVLWLVSR